jgi:hypothetical protein
LIARVTSETSFGARFYNQYDQEIDRFGRSITNEPSLNRVSFSELHRMVANILLKNFGVMNPDPYNVSIYRHFRELVLLQKDGGSEGGGNYHTFNYVFRECF